ncbi:MAG: GNAT family N-acetyltransferase [Bacteroidales bacterium]|nr:GNAT family N-acetyltransferase [Bacteroidales bacterium]
MSVRIIEVASRKQLKDFIRFPYKLFKNCQNWVPALENDEFDTFNPKNNGAYDYCEAQLFLAYKENEIVGRVAAIINRNANEKWGKKVVRFGWLDFIEDKEVLEALMDSVGKWGAARSCDTMSGPLGFTDMDKEGLLVEGYENLSPFTCLYNYPYYDRMLMEAGFRKETDWTQKVALIKPELPPMFQYAEMIEKRFDIHVARAKSTREFCRKYGMDIFHMYNTTFAELFQFTPISDKQIKRYLQTYVPILIPDFVAVCVDGNDKPIGFTFCVPSLSKAVKKSGGKLFPFGFINILRALKKNDTLEALMIGVLPEYQGKGANVLMFKYIHENCIKHGITRMILNPQLEDNFKVQSLFQQYETTPYMRRRAYVKEL